MADIPTIYALIFFGYGLLVASLVIKEKVIGLISGLFLLVLSIFIFVNGVNDMNNYVTLFFAAMTFVVGAFISVMAGFTFIREGL